MNRYECICNYKSEQIHVNVFAENKTDLKYKAAARAVEFLKELGSKGVIIEEIRVIGFIDRGPFEFVD